jgi:DNA-binding transcriptional ArsR family regulator
MMPASGPGRHSELAPERLDLDRLVANAERASDFLKAMSHKPRLIILCLLIEGEKTVVEIERKLSAPQPAVSQQLARLRLVKLVRTRRVGKNVYYSLSRPEVREVVTTLHRIFCKTVDGDADFNPTHSP